MLFVEDVTQLTAEQIFARLTFLPVLLSSIIGLIRYRRLAENLRLLAILNWFELPLQIVGIALMMMRKSNLFLMPIYTVGELALLALVYRQTLQSAAFSRVIPWLVGSFTLYVLFDSFWTPEALQWVRSGQQVIQSLLILALAATYFRKLLNELRVERLSQEPMFWVSLGLTLYFLGYVQIALFSKYMMESYSARLNANFWTVETALNYLLHLCYAYALWMRPQK